MEHKIYQSNYKLLNLYLPMRNCIKSRNRNKRCFGLLVIKKYQLNAGDETCDKNQI